MTEEIFGTSARKSKMLLKEIIFNLFLTKVFSIYWVHNGHSSGTVDEGQYSLYGLAP
jgi:hypothetical protein